MASNRAREEKKIGNKLSFQAGNGRVGEIVVVRDASRAQASEPRHLYLSSLPGSK
jgi:hypothetical protein